MATATSSVIIFFSTASIFILFALAVLTASSSPRCGSFVLTTPSTLFGLWFLTLAASTALASFGLFPLAATSFRFLRLWWSDHLPKLAVGYHLLHFKPASDLSPPHKHSRE